MWLYIVGANSINGHLIGFAANTHFVGVNKMSLSLSADCTADGAERVDGAPFVLQHGDSHGGETMQTPTANFCFKKVVLLQEKVKMTEFLLHFIVFYSVTTCSSSTLWSPGSAAETNQPELSDSVEIHNKGNKGRAVKSLNCFLVSSVKHDPVELWSEVKQKADRSIHRRAAAQ